MGTTFTQNAQIYAGDDAVIEILVTEEDDTTPIDLSGHVLTFRMGYSPAGPTIVEKISDQINEWNMAQANQGIAGVILLDTDTAGLHGNYYWQAFDRDATGIDTLVAAGQITVLRKLPAKVEP